MSNSNEVFGLDDQEVLDSKRLIRDVRSPFKKFTDFISDGKNQCYGMVLLMCAMFIMPGLANLFFILTALLCLMRLLGARKEQLPFRMPKGLTGVDPGDPLPGRRGFSAPEGIFYFGNKSGSREELWLKAKDILTHMLLFGTTGSGKTETLVSLNFNALATGSGFFYIDPKASPKLAVQVWQLARFCGRDDDFRVLNYGTSGKTRGKSPRRFSNTNNPFSIGQAESLTQILVSLMPASGGGNEIFADNAQTFISGVMYALVCLRDKGKIKISVQLIRNTITVDACIKLAENPDLDDHARSALHASLSSCGWLQGRPLEEQPDSFVEQLGYAKAYFGKTLSSLTDTYSHIYGTEDGEVDINDIILQRRVLVVLLPALEKSSAELTSLGKISLSSIKNACAVGLGSRIEGDAADVLEALPTDSIGIGPFVSTVDEYGAIVTPGYEIVLTQGRSLGIAAIVASQDYPGIVEADKKGAQQMVANTTIKVFMKIDDEATVKLAQTLTGDAEVIRTSGFSMEKGSSTYQDSNNTQVQKVSRIHLKDLQNQIEGEAHYIFRGKVVRGDMFYASPPLKNAQLRIPQQLSPAPIAAQSEGA